jgi:hypothetical protein
LTWGPWCREIAFHYVEVTPALVEIHPGWRGHYYFVVDGEIIVVDAGGRIVAIVDV